MWLVNKCAFGAFILNLSSGSLRENSKSVSGIQKPDPDPKIQLCIGHNVRKTKWCAWYIGTCRFVLNPGHDRSFNIEVDSPVFYWLRSADASGLRGAERRVPWAGAAGEFLEQQKMFCQIWNG
jgi:hypothetical protein